MHFSDSLHSYMTYSTDKIERVVELELCVAETWERDRLLVPCGRHGFGGILIHARVN